MKKISKIRRTNAKLYPIYKMFSWDLLFFYSIQFLFLTITKGLTATEILITSSFYLIFKIIMQIPAVAISDIYGKKKALIAGNVMLIVYVIILMCSSNIGIIIIANAFCALGFDLKQIAEPNLIYDSVSTKGGDGLYSRLEARGSSMYFTLDGITAFLAGYLFVINNYLPMFACLVFLIIATFISFKFENVYPVKRKEDMTKGISKALKEYEADLKFSFKFILKSRRIKSLILFQIVFYGLFKILEVYQSNLLVDIHIPEEQFTMIFGILGLIGGISVSLKRTIEKKFKKRTLRFLGISYIIPCVTIGLITSITTQNYIIPFVLALMIVQKMATSLWFVFEAKYLTSFSSEHIRNKITFTYKFVGYVVASILSLLGGLLLKIISVENAYLIIGLVSLASLTLVLDYMRTRLGLKPTQYKKEDLFV